MIKFLLTALIITSTIIINPFLCSAKELYFIDAHSQMDGSVSGNTILKLMNNNGVKRTILASRGQCKPRTIIAFASANPGKIIPSMSTKQFGYASRYREKHNKSIEIMQKMASSGRFKSMAETLMWHSGCPNNRCPSIEVNRQDARLETALAIAVKNGWPFIPHIEFGSLSGGKRKRFLDDLESMLSQYPGHPFALIHMGQLKIVEVKRLIEKYENIHFLTAHSNTLAVKSAGGFKPWIDMFDGRSLSAPWRQLLIEHPDRFIFAMDNVWSQTHWQRGLYDGQIKLWREALSQLPEEAAHALAHGNAERLWRIPVD